MHLANLFKRKRPSERAVCPSCGRACKDGFNFCPSCGTRLPSEGEGWRSRMELLAQASLADEVGRLPPEREEYLRLRGLSQEAQRWYTVRLSIQGSEPVNIRLYGWQTDYHAIDVLKRAGLIDANERYEILGWPSVTPEWPGNVATLYRRVSASVCELPDILYRVDLYGALPHPCLYGCPNARELENVVLTRRVEVIDYAG